MTAHHLGYHYAQEAAVKKDFAQELILTAVVFGKMSLRKKKKKKKNVEWDVIWNMEWNMDCSCSRPLIKKKKKKYRIRATSSRQHIRDSSMSNSDLYTIRFSLGSTSYSCAICSNLISETAHI